MDHYLDIGRALRSKEALLKRGNEGETVYHALGDIDRSVRAMRDADAESAHREYNPEEQRQER